MIVLTLPYPVSANRYWRPLPVAGRNIFVLTKEAKQFKADTARIAAAAGLRAPLAGRVQIGLSLYPNRPKDFAARQRKLGAWWDDGVQCLDLDNVNKVVMDALKGVVIDDDKWVWSLSSQRMEPDDRGTRVVVYVRQLVQPATQRELLETA